MRRASRKRRLENFPAVLRPVKTTSASNPHRPDKTPHSHHKSPARRFRKDRFNDCLQLYESKPLARFAPIAAPQGEK
jgi:hypothetical protein